MKSSCLEDQSVIAFVDGTLDDDSARAVKRHIDVCEMCRVLVAENARANPGTDRVAIRSDTFFERYSIQSIVGKGAMGIVYSAYDRRLDRRVALKLLSHSESHSPATRIESSGDIVLAEARAMARISHRNVVSVYDAGLVDDRVFLAMEFIDGAPLRTWLRERRPWRDIVHAFIEAGRGLSALHAAGVVHRDFKPDNVMVGKDGRVCVTDFGLARLAITEETAQLTEVSRENAHPALAPMCTALTGTPRYMAPEQYVGEPIDGRADQFAFCVSLYEALFGAIPFDGESVERIREAMAKGELRGKPANDRLSVRLYRILARGLCPAPRDRFASMDALLSELAGLFTTRTPSKVAMAATVCAAIGLLSWTAFATKPDKAASCNAQATEFSHPVTEDGADRIRTRFLETGKPFAEEAAAKVRAQLSVYSERIRGAYAQNCAEPPPADVRANVDDCLRKRQLEFDALTQALFHADATAVTNAISAAAALADPGICRLSPGKKLPRPHDRDIDAKVSSLESKLAEAQAMVRVGHDAEGRAAAERVVHEAAELRFKPMQTRSLLLLGEIQTFAHDREQAEPTLREAILSAEASGDDERLVEARLHLARVVGDFYFRVNDGRHLAQEAHAVIERLGSPRHLLAKYFSTKGDLAFSEFHFADAFEAYKKARELQEELSPDSEALAAAIWNMARARYWNADTAAARDLFEQSLHRREHLYGPGHPLVAQAEETLGNALVALGEVEEGRHWLTRSLAEREASLGKEHVELLGSLLGLGEAELRKGAVDAAERFFGRALEIGVTMPDLSVAGECRLGVAEVALVRRDFARALIEYRQSQKEMEATLGARHPLLVRALEGAAHAELGLGRTKNAQSTLMQALAVCETEPCAPHHRAEIEWMLGQSLWSETRERHRAVELVRRAAASFAKVGPLSEKNRRSADAWLQLHSHAIPR